MDIEVAPRLLNTACLPKDGGCIAAGAPTYGPLCLYAGPSGRFLCGLE
jgi:hypothetical protein